MPKTKAQKKASVSAAAVVALIPAWIAVAWYVEQQFNWEPTDEYDSGNYDGIPFFVTLAAPFVVYVVAWAGACLYSDLYRDFSKKFEKR